MSLDARVTASIVVNNNLTVIEQDINIISS